MKFNRLKCITFLVFVFPLLAHAQTFTTLVNFDGTNGNAPAYITLIQGMDGNMYGTTAGGGNNPAGGGVVFQMTAEGKISLLYNFCSQPNCSDGQGPAAGLVLGTDGNFYGTTELGGDLSCPFYGTCGTVFKVTPQGVLTSLHTFSQSDGGLPVTPLTQATDGEFYGTTMLGGTSDVCTYGCGVAFKVTSTGTFTVLHNFDFDVDGQMPNALIQVGSGNFYGTTLDIWDGAGTLFTMNENGAVTTIHTFGGGGPRSGVFLGSDGNLYGTTQDDTAYESTLQGSVTILAAPYYQPWAGLVEATDGNFYGTTLYGGIPNCEGIQAGCGTVYQLTPQGVLTVLHEFDGADGSMPYGGLFQATNGKIYGTTFGGGANGDGTVYELDMGLAPFVSLIRSFGKVGLIDGILGQGFKDTTSVSFNRIRASFTVMGDAFLKVSVPAGATTGPVTVSTPGGMLTSNAPFKVLPQLLSFDPPSGPVGTQVTITGVSLIQTSGVGFGDRVPANFTVNSDTQVTATVPAGAKTGFVGIQTAGGTAISTQVFTVTK